jgi:putative NADH-flavin reductase
MIEKSIAVFGASGRTGKEILNIALAKGFFVNAFCRNKSLTSLTNNNLNIIEGDLLKYNSLKSAIAPSGYVIIALGHKLPYKEIFCSEGTKNIVKAMYECNVNRLICITGAMIGDYPGILSRFMYKMKERFNKSYPLIALDRLKQELAVKASGLDWTIIKPPRLTDGKIGKYKMSEKMGIGALSSISRKTVASIIMDILINNSTYQKALFVKK